MANPVISLSYRTLFRREPSEKDVAELLRGVSLDSLVGFCSSVCHTTTICLQETGSVETVIAEQNRILESLVPPGLRREILGALSHRRAYRDKSWALTNNHLLLVLIGAYFRENPKPRKDKTSRSDFERLTNAVLMINDLASPPNESEGSSIPALTYIFALNQRSQWRHLVSRSLDIYCKRLCGEIPRLAEEFEATTGFSPDEFASLVHGLYCFLASQLISGPETRAEFRYGLFGKGRFAPGNPEDESLLRLIKYLAASPSEFSNQFHGMDISVPSVLPLLRKPIVDVGDGDFWCPDPYLLISTAGPGMFWLFREVYQAAGGNVHKLFETVGKPVFEGYVDTLLAGFGVSIEENGRCESGSDEISDVILWEPPTLILIELKAVTMKEEVKWSHSRTLLDEELERIICNCQLMRAAKRVFEEGKTEWRTAARIVPVIVTLDPSFATPGTEPYLNQRIEKPEVPVIVEDVHLLSIEDFEAAGNYLDNSVFSRLLDVRRREAPNGQLSVNEIILNHKSQVAGSCGGWWEPTDVFGQAENKIKDAILRAKQKHGQ